LHGHKEFPEVFEKRVETIVMGHLHPSIVLRDKQNIKKEKYRCFLTGKYKRKEVVVVPSFPNIIRGFSMNELEYGEINKLKNEFSIIPYKNLKKFSVHAINDDGEVFDFGELRKL
jgi:metallophosphoesterase superfamily enzyme